MFAQPGAKQKLNGTWVLERKKINEQPRRKEEKIVQQTELPILEENRQSEQKRQHLSYSELKTWAECSHKHKLIYLDKIRKFQGNEYTAFGTALHYVNENIVDKNIPLDEAKLMFQKKFLEELKEVSKTHKLNAKLVTDMRNAGRRNHSICFTFFG